MKNFSMALFAAFVVATVTAVLAAIVVSTDGGDDAAIEVTATSAVTAADTETADTSTDTTAADTGITVTSTAGKLFIASAKTKTPLVELYTSEGCSSCPPADDWLRALGAAIGGDLRAVPLAFHVDYWNYLGWPDPYSNPAFTKRQRRIAATNRSGVYTPALVVDGRTTRRGGLALRAIETANAQTAAANIEVHVARIGGGNIETRIAIDNRSGATLDAFLAVYESGITREIGGGENRGRTLQHDFVVRHWSAPIRMRRGENHKRLELAIPKDWRRRNLGLAVIALRRDGETVQAVNAPLAALFAG